VTVEGVDYSSGRPGGAALVKAGKKFVCRYLTYRGIIDPRKALDAAELKDLRSHGLALVLNFESTATRAKGGARLGKPDAIDALAAIETLHLPSFLPVYFSADWDTTPADYPAIDAYLTAAAGVLGPERIGLYGEYAVLAHVRAARTARWFWQTYAWSGGKVASWAHIYQYRNGQRINGAAVDFDRALRANYGQWANTLDTPIPESDTETPMAIYRRDPESGHFTVKSGSTVHGLRPTDTGWEEAKVVSFSDDSGANYSGVLHRIAGTLTPSVLLEVEDGAFAGLYVSSAEVTPTADPAPPALTQADLDRAVQQAVDSTKASARVTIAFG
jgi:hypothetical protein